MTPVSRASVPEWSEGGNLRQASHLTSPTWLLPQACELCPPHRVELTVSTSTPEFWSWHGHHSVFLSHGQKSFPTSPGPLFLISLLPSPVPPLTGCFLTFSSCTAPRVPPGQCVITHPQPTPNLTSPYLIAVRGMHTRAHNPFCKEPDVWFSSAQPCMDLI